MSPSVLKGAAFMTKTITLNNQVQIPVIGYGVWQVEDNIQECVETALECGYRHIDTAAAYGNESGVGRALEHSGISRDQIFITTKLWNEDMRQDRTAEAFQESLEKLRLDYVDLYLLHWPVKEKYIHCYREIEKLYRQGLIKAIGVSNCLQHQLDPLLQACEIIPAVNQIQLHPQWVQTDYIAYMKAKGIAVEAYSPLGHGNLIHDPTLQEIAKKYERSTAQIMIRWHLQRGVIVLPKSSHPNRIRENINVFDFEIAPEDMDRITGLNRDVCFNGHPDTFNF